MPTAEDDGIYLEHIFVDFPKRKITIVDTEGYDEIVKYSFDEDGAEGFLETVATFKQTLPDDLVTYVSI